LGSAAAALRWSTFREAAVVAPEDQIPSISDPPSLRAIIPMFGDGNGLRLLIPKKPQSGQISVQLCFEKIQPEG
jgi:hypothetical protein